jgi:F-type H+-transporting ATPase subunit b
MAGELIIVAQAESGMAAEEVVIAGEEEHAATETHEGTEAEGHAPTVFPPFDPQHFASQILWLVLTFGFLYVVMSRTALPRIGSILEQRRIRIEGDLKEADRLRQETDRAIQAYEQALAEARQRAHAIAEETRSSIRADIEGKRAAVEADLARKVADAEASIQVSKAEALTNVETIAADTAAELVRRITGEAPTGDVGAAVSQASKG